MARYSPVKLFQAAGLSALDDLCIYTAPTETIVKQIIITNTNSASVTVGLSFVNGGWNQLEPNDAFNTLNYPAAGVGGWTASNASLALTSGYLSFTSTASGTVYVEFPTLSSAAVGAGPMTAMAVQPNTLYTLGASHKTAVTGRLVTAGLNWFTSLGATISSLTAYTVTDTTSFVASSGSLTSPATAAYVQPFFGYSSVASSEVHSLENIGLYPTGVGGLPTQARSYSRVLPDMSVPPGITVLDLSAVLNGGDFISAKASAAGVNVYASGVMVQ